MTLRLQLERILMEMARDDQAALETLYNHFYPRLYNFSRSFLKLEDGIDDILQEVFVRIWKNRKKIKSPDTFNAFIFAITRNLLINELRNRMNDQHLRKEVFKRAVAEEYVTSDESVYRELEAKVSELIQQLPKRQLEIFLLSRVEGLSHKQISQKLNVSEKTVEYHITQSIKILKKKLESIGLISLLWFYLFL
jgi:RNA polymerase sigma-70 factor, ECF subfamily